MMLKWWEFKFEVAVAGRENSGFNNSNEEIAPKNSRVKKKQKDVAERYWIWNLQKFYNSAWLQWLSVFCSTGIFSRDYSRLGQVLWRKTLGIAEADFFTGGMPFLSPNQQQQNTEGVIYNSACRFKILAVCRVDVQCAVKVVIQYLLILV